MHKVYIMHSAHLVHTYYKVYTLDVYFLKSEHKTYTQKMCTRVLCTTGNIWIVSAHFIAPYLINTAPLKLVVFLLEERMVGRPGGHIIAHELIQKSLLPVPGRTLSSHLPRLKADAFA